METSRRGFVAGGVASLCGLPAVAHAADASKNSASTNAAPMNAATANPAAAPDGEPILDYDLSFLCNSWPENSVRFWLESRTLLFDPQNNTRREIWQCASCKSENTFGEKDLFLADNYDFMPLFDGDDVLIFRSFARVNDRYRQLTTSDKVWGKPVPKFRFGQNVKLLETWEAIRDATAAAVPIVTRTELRDEKTGLRAIIECPVKTMNISHTQKMYQVDTGPIALPDLSKRYEPAIDCIRLAFVAFNAPDFADFVIEQPTALNAEPEGCQTYHYSSPISVPATNQIYAVGSPA